MPEIQLILPNGGVMTVDSGLVPRVGEHVHFAGKAHPVRHVEVVYVDPGQAKACPSCGAGGKERDHYRVFLGPVIA